MVCGPKECIENAERCLRRARTMRDPILAEKLAQSWLRLAKAAERGGLIVQPQFKKRDEFRA
jgi:hypothetical protein